MTLTSVNVINFPQYQTLTWLDKNIGLEKCFFAFEIDRHDCLHTIGGMVSVYVENTRLQYVFLNMVAGHVLHQFFVYSEQRLSTCPCTKVCWKPNCGAELLGSQNHQRSHPVTVFADHKYPFPSVGTRRSLEPRICQDGRSQQAHPISRVARYVLCAENTFNSSRNIFTTVPAV